MYNGGTIMKNLKLSDSLKKYSSCRYCKYYNNNGTCKAFPKGIPLDILNGTFNHHTKHKGDNGIQFEIDEEKTREEDALYDKYKKYFEEEE